MDVRRRRDPERSGAVGAFRCHHTTRRPAAGPQAERLLHGEIRPFRGDYRAAIARIDGLARRLGQNPHVAEVRTIKMPLNVSPKAVLSGNTLDSGGEPATAEFELLIVFKPRV